LKDKFRNLEKHSDDLDGRTKRIQARVDKQRSDRILKDLPDTDSEVEKKRKKELKKKYKKRKSRSKATSTSYEEEEEEEEEDSEEENNNNTSTSSKRSTPKTRSKSKVKISWKAKITENRKRRKKIMKMKKNKKKRKLTRATRAQKTALKKEVQRDLPRKNYQRQRKPSRKQKEPDEDVLAKIFKCIFFSIKQKISSFKFSYVIFVLRTFLPLRSSVTSPG
jgi:hypothetical protein